MTRPVRCAVIVAVVASAAHLRRRVLLAAYDRSSRHRYVLDRARRRAARRDLVDMSLLLRMCIENPELAFVSDGLDALK